MNHTEVLDFEIIQRQIENFANDLNRSIFAKTGENHSFLIQEQVREFTGNDQFVIDDEFSEEPDELDVDYTRRDEPEDQFRTDAEADGDVLASAGMGTDEDYGYFGNDGDDGD